MAGGGAPPATVNEGWGLAWGSGRPFVSVDTLGVEKINWAVFPTAFGCRMLGIASLHKCQAWVIWFQLKWIERC